MHVYIHVLCPDSGLAWVCMYGTYNVYQILFVVMCMKYYSKKLGHATLSKQNYY